MNEEKQPMIYKALLDIQDDILGIGKDNWNEQGYKFRGIDDVLKTLAPLLRKHRVLCMPMVEEETRELRKTAKGATLLHSLLQVTFRFVAEDGSEMICRTRGEGMDTGDKATNKATSGAYKNMAFFAFCIPVENMPDSENDNHAVGDDKKKSTRTARTGKKTETAGKKIEPGAVPAPPSPTAWLADRINGCKDSAALAALREQWEGSHKENKINEQSFSAGIDMLDTAADDIPEGLGLTAVTSR